VTNERSDEAAVPGSFVAVRICCKAARARAGRGPHRADAHDDRPSRPRARPTARIARGC